MCQETMLFNQLFRTLKSALCALNTYEFYNKDTDCVLSKYSRLLSVLHFKSFHAAAVLSIFTLVSTEGAARGFKIE